MTVALAIDSSTRTIGLAIVTSDLEVLWTETLRLHGSWEANVIEGPSRLAGILQSPSFAKSIGLTEWISVCGIESPWGGANQSVAVKLGIAAGCYLYAMRSIIETCYLIQPKEAKAAVARGNASKEEVRRAVIAMMKMRDTEDLGLDASDAIAIGRAALIRHEVETLALREV